MMILLDEFNKLTNGKYDFVRLASCMIKVSHANVTMELLAPYEQFASISNEEKAEITQAMRAIIPSNLELIVNIKRSYVDNDIVTKFVYDFTAREYPTVGFGNIDFNIVVNPDKILIAVKVKTVYFSYMDSTDYTGRLTEYLSHCYCRDTEVELVEDEGMVNFEFDDSMLSGREVYIARRITTTDHEMIKGKAIITPAQYIADRKEVENNAVYCGKIVEYQRRTAKSGNPFYVITIDDTTGRLVTKAFTKSPQVSEYDQLKQGDNVIVQGKITLDAFVKDSVMMINSIAKCNIDYSNIVLKENFKEVNSYYANINPLPYVSSRQVNIFDLDKDESVPECLIGHDIVVFDLETTGFEKSCKIIEIGAVKIRDGKFIETFSTLVDPQEKLPPKIVEITNITDEMLVGQPSIEDVMPDFYKFTRGALMVAHNASFDMGFITKYGYEQKFNFDNEVYDTCAMARLCVNATNYKLGTLCETLDIKLVDAHRALADAEATAYLFVELIRRKPL